MQCNNRIYICVCEQSQLVSYKMFGTLNQVQAMLFKLTNGNMVAKGNLITVFILKIFT